MKKTTRRSLHYTCLGLSLQPREADACGYLSYREGFESLPRSAWTTAEDLIACAELAIERWRRAG